MAVQTARFERVVMVDMVLKLTEAGRRLFWVGYFREFERPRLGSILMCRVQPEDDGPSVVYGLLQFFVSGEEGYLQLEVETGKSHTVFFGDLLELDGDPIKLVEVANRAVRIPRRSHSRPRRETYLEL